MPTQDDWVKMISLALGLLVMAAGFLNFSIPFTEAEIPSIAGLVGALIAIVSSWLFPSPVEAKRLKAKDEEIASLNRMIAKQSRRLQEKKE